MIYKPQRFHDSQTKKAAMPGSTNRGGAPLIGKRRVRAGNGRCFALDVSDTDRDVASLRSILADSECEGFEVRRLLEQTLIDVRREVARAACASGVVPNRGR